MNIQLEDISVSYGEQPILEKINLELSKKELVMLVGLNGSGKTTLMRILLGFQSPNYGKVWYNHICLEQISVKERGKMISYVPQHLQVELHYTVQQFLLLGITPYLNLFQMPHKKYILYMDQILEEFQLAHLKNQLVSSLSGGERQLLYFARAKVQNTHWMVLDEPLASLDYLRQHEFMEHLLQYKTQSEQGILLSVHDPNFALNYADQVVILHKHNIIAVLHRTDAGFEEQLTQGLNQVYKNHLQLIKKKSFYIYGWKEEKLVTD